MNGQRKCGILFASTILAARKLNESGNTPWAIHVAITDAIDKAELILEKFDERWPGETVSGASGCPRTPSAQETRKLSGRGDCRLD